MGWWCVWIMVRVDFVVRYGGEFRVVVRVL